MNAKGKVIATDLDGTLFYPKKRIKMISERNLSFLRRFVDEGGRVLLISGRNYFYLKRVVARLKRDVDYAGCNGAFLVINQKMINESLMENNHLKEVLQAIKDKYHPSGFFLMTRDYPFVTPKQSFGLFNRFGLAAYQLSQGIYKEKAYKNEKILASELANGKIYKVMIFFGISKKQRSLCLKANTELRETYPEYDFAWQDQCIEMTNISATKANAVKQYLDYLKIKHDNVMVVGDSGNDISMFRHFQNSFCMNRAPKEVSKYAKHLINGVSELEKYLVDTKEKTNE